MRLPEVAQAVVEVLRAAGYKPEVEVRGHIKIRAPGLPLIVCAKSPSDWRVRTSAIALAKRLIRHAAAQPH